MDVEDGGIRAPGLVARGLHDEPVDLGAVLALGGEILGGRQLQLGLQRRVVLRDGAEGAPVEHGDFGEGRGGHGHQREVAVGLRPRVRDANHAPAVRDALYASCPERSRGAFGRHARHLLRAIVLQQERDAAAVGRPRRARYRAVERCREDTRRCRLRGVGRHHGQLVQPVGRVLVVVAHENGETRSVGAPRRAAALALGRGGEPHGLGACARLDHPQVVVRRPVGLGVRALAEKGDARAVRRPRRAPIVDAALGERGGGLRGDVEDGDVLVDVREVALAVLLEVVAVDHDGRRGLPLPALLLLGLGVGVFVARHEHQPRAVGRPRVVGDAALHVGQLHSLAARSRQQPHLRAALLLVLGAARGHERQVLAVRAPAGRRLAVGRRGQLQLLAAVPPGHPHVAVALVLLFIDSGHRVGHPLAIG